ncbi:MAG: radical SAM protein [Deltaproteobacteria bacterium]|nr:radical SAM protein [Deltaproteobacteria bacterium]MBN2846546.1 radical SAM protein [Deltaproteobacteria bacterium]
MKPGYQRLYEQGILNERAGTLARLMRDCTLCPRKCRVDRLSGERGFCGLGGSVILNRGLPHHGEEPPISGSRGAGTIFFSSCNLRCSYCQNYQISHRAKGRVVDSKDLSGLMLSLQERGCHNIDAVTATPHLAGFSEALDDACGKGLTIPIVYNSSGYENPEVVMLLDGMVDLYLPDFKYGNDNDARLFSSVGDYCSFAVPALKEMVRQVGDSLDMVDGIARRGIIVRHLILPGRVENSLQVLRLIKRNISTSVSLSIMSQYTPIPALEGHPLMGRRITEEEYERVVNEALDMGFDTIFAQEVSDNHMAPDFDRDTPFLWG